MTDEPNHATNGHGDYERRDIGIAGVLYFLIGLAVFMLLAHLVVTSLFHYLDQRSKAEQTPVSPMVTNAPVDTRHLPTDYRDYLKQNFPSPQLEVDERTQLNGIITAQEEQLSTYGYIDKQAGTVRIPIERAMELIAQRGLPVRAQGAAAESQPASETAKNQAVPATKKGKKK
ncbi:MAG TPA: hypothetical protein VMD99_06785 [Terriglobales bacterium]|jgi:hypothetical protein|nr:hypothetical protein [Terriglobales bacterium]